MTCPKFVTQAIAKDVHGFYRIKYLDVVASRGTSIHAAIADLQSIYEFTMFPYMKVDWRTHPNNIGHFYPPGCFRCRDGQHVSPRGKVIPKNCDTWHTAQAQLESGAPLMRHEEGI
ncbi:MAG: hypothetical protein WB660_15045 [Candidatus Sulfotelmatobacter sp.]